MAYTLQAKYMTLRPKKGRKFDQANWSGMNLQLKLLCNPWYVPAGFQAAGITLDIINPTKNVIPLVPWL
jgi:hypothetical protein